MVFTDESYFGFDHGRWLWTRRDEISDEILHAQPKYPAKVTIFAGISRDFKSDLVTMSGTINDITYLNDFVTAPGPIPEMGASGKLPMTILA
jgi:hypothetical protein